MKKIAIIIVFFCNMCAYSQVATIKPIERTVGNLHISIDPRMELLTAAQLVSNTPYIDRQKVIKKDNEPLSILHKIQIQSLLKPFKSMLQGFSICRS